MELRKAGELEHPLCPHCEKQLTEVVAKPFDKTWHKMIEKYIYYCPHCRKVLGIAHSVWV